MKTLKTRYMGIELDNPIIVGASNLSNDLNKLKLAEDSGAAAIVFKSLFEEQIQLESFQLERKLTEFDDLYAEMVTMHPRIEHAGPEEHLLNLRNAKESLSIPVIASLNAINRETWIKYAGQLAETGVDAIELNFYQTPSDFNRSSADIEEEQVNIVKEIIRNSTIPVGVKLSSDYTNILSFVNRLDQYKVKGVVLFNSFFQPDIDVVGEKHIKSFNLSNEGDYKKSLRYTGILFGNIKADICASRGIFSGEDVVRMLLSGSAAVQIVSTLYKNGLPEIKRIKNYLSDWMDARKYSSIDDFRGKLSKTRIKNDPFVYKRAQYVDLMINSEEIFGIPG